MDWTQRVAVLADGFSAAGKLTSPQWRAAFCAVPRHELVPEIYVQDENREWRLAEAGTEQWWDLVYSDHRDHQRAAQLPGHPRAGLVVDQARPHAADAGST